MKYRNLLFSFFMVMQVACSDNFDLQGVNSEGRVPVILTAGGSTATPMRASSDLYTAATGFDGGEQVKVWMYKNEEQGTVSALYDVGAPTAGVSALTLSSGETAMYYPTGDAGIVTLYGVYPNTSQTSHTVKYDQTNSTVGNANYKASDLMYAKTDATWTNATEKLALKPNLAFEHQLCKLTLTIVKTNSVKQVEKVRMVNVKRSVPVSAIAGTGMTLGTPATASGETAAEGDNKDEIVLLKEGESQTLNEETYVYSCVFVPQEWSDDAIFEVDADGVTAYFRTTKVFVGGKEYGTTLNISGASLKITSTIEDWAEGEEMEWSDIKFHD